MYTGRVCPEKGVLELIKAFKKVLAKAPNAKLMVVGSRWYNQIDKDEYFNSLIEESEEIKDKIIFTGYVYPEDMPEIYGLANTLIIPSMWEEPFGVVALEGMAMRVPIISTKSGGLVEVLNADTAILIDRENIIDELECAMLKIKEVQIAEKLVRNARKKLERTREFWKINYYDEFAKRVR